MTTLILPGVGGSEPEHWQSWLQTELSDAKRIEQADWHSPVLHTWRLALDQALLAATEPVWIVAHSFGCLVTMSALSSRVLANKVAGVLLVAPASPERFNLEGLVHKTETLPEDQSDLKKQPSSAARLSRVLPRAPLGLPIRMIASRTDPWLDFETAEWWATRWGAKLIDLGDAGHINVAAGYGAWPEVITELNILKYGSRAVEKFAARHTVHHDADTNPQVDTPSTQNTTEQQNAQNAIVSSVNFSAINQQAVFKFVPFKPEQRSASNHAKFHLVATSGNTAHGQHVAYLSNKQVV